MGISQNSLEQIRSAIDPLDVVREAVPSIKQTGNRWRGLCPFHNERTPSFFFMPEKGLWHCFGTCQEGGDVFKFVMKLESMSFLETVRYLAKRVGISIELENDSGPSQRVQKEREKLFDILEQASSFYHESLMNSADGELARRYLAERKIKPDTIQTFQLGYAPLKNAFYEKVLQKGTPIELLQKAALAVRSAQGNRYHDPLQNRLIFPIHDAYGRVVAFGGRTMDPNSRGPKYINSSETPVYTKGRHLYGIYQGRSVLREQRQALLVEGYMDVIGCYQGGARYAVAPLGTALTKEQALLIKRYVQEVFLLFDADAAGEKASWRSSEIFLQNDLFVRVAHLPSGKDPDEFILKEGLAGLEEVLHQAKDIVDFWLDQFPKSSMGDYDQLHRRVRQAEEMVKNLQKVQNPLLREEWIRKISKRLSLDETTLRKGMKGPAGEGKSSFKRPVVSLSVQKGTGAVSLKNKIIIRSVEEEMIQLVCGHKEFMGSDQLLSNLFLTPRCRLVFENLKKQWASEKKIDTSRIVGELTPQDGNWFSSLLLEEKVFSNAAETFEKGICRLKNLVLQREYEGLGKEVLQMMEGRLPEDKQKIARYQYLTHEIKGSVSRTVRT